MTPVAHFLFIAAHLVTSIHGTLNSCQHVGSSTVTIPLHLFLVRSIEGGYILLPCYSGLFVHLVTACYTVDGDGHFYPPKLTEGFVLPNCSSAFMKLVVITE